MKDFPEEIILICEALSQKNSRRLLIKLLDKPMKREEVDEETVEPLINAGMVSGWTRNFEDYYYEVNGLGRGVINALASIFSPKRKEVSEHG